MSNTEIVRAWKDPDYRATLAKVPTLPIGSIELDDPYLAGGVPITQHLASRRGEHTTVFGCHTHSACSSSCQTVSHCPHTGWQCRAV